MKKIFKKAKPERIKDFFLHNFSAKMVSLLAALLLWVIVASSQGTLGKLPGKIQVKAINVADGLVAVYDEKEVEVQILANPTDWQKISVSSFTAYVDLAGLPEGTYELDVQVTTTVSDIQIVSKSPKKILVSVERIVTKEVNINTKVEGSAAEGLVAGNIELEPSLVEVSGPKSVVENITEVTAPIILNGEAKDFEKIVDVVAYSSNGEVVDFLTFHPDQVLAKISIVQASNNKTVGVKVNTFGSPAENYFISKVTVLPSTIDITGPSSVLQTINYIETEEIDISNISENYEIEVRLNIPRGAALQSGEENMVEVLFTVEKADTSRTVTIDLEYVNLKTGLKLTDDSQKSIEISIIGSQQTINSIVASDFIYQVDLSDFDSGQHQIDLDIEEIVFDKNVSVTSISPEQMNIVLE